MKNTSGKGILFGLIGLFALFAIALYFLVLAINEPGPDPVDHPGIAERIAPVGEVNVTPSTESSTSTAVESSAPSSDSDAVPPAEKTTTPTATPASTATANTTSATPPSSASTEAESSQAQSNSEHQIVYYDKDKNASAAPAGNTGTANTPAAAIPAPSANKEASPPSVESAKAVAPASAPAAPVAAGDKPYTISAGKVDENTFTGWQTYRGVGCGQCHGGAAQGGAAPSLVERLKTISKEQFVASVTNGKNLMPPWKNNQKVMGNLDKMYAYLKARSDGALGEEKPQK